MYTDDDYLPSPRPFWFASDELLTGLFRAEINEVARLFQKYPDVRMLLDSPEPTLSQRTACFKLLAHLKLVAIVEDTFLGHHEQPPSPSEEEKDVLRRTVNLVVSDSPPWALEVNGVVERLPSHIYGALPETLRKGGFGFDGDNPAQVEAVRSAAKTLSSVEQIQEFAQGVIDQQLGRLERRWSATIAQVQEGNEQKGSKRPLKGVEGLVRKANLSRYMHNLTEKQQLAFSLKYEYELGLSEIASRMSLDRKTAYEHIEAAKKKIDEAVSSEKRSSNRVKSTPDF